MDEIKTVSELFVLITEQMCDNYCKFPEQCSSEDELMEHCENCPMTRL